MATLTARQRMKLKSLAHSLKPLIYIGKEGITPATIQAIETAFNTRELLKIKVQESAPTSARESSEILAEQIEGAHVAQVIGRTVVLYRRHPEKPKIELPPSKTSPDRT